MSQCHLTDFLSPPVLVSIRLVRKELCKNRNYTECILYVWPEIPGSVIKNCMIWAWLCVVSVLDHLFHVCNIYFFFLLQVNSHFSTRQSAKMFRLGDWKVWCGILHLVLLVYLLHYLLCVPNNSLVSKLWAGKTLFFILKH